MVLSSKVRQAGFAKRALPIEADVQRIENPDQGRQAHRGLALLDVENDGLADTSKARKGGLGEAALPAVVANDGSEMLHMKRLVLLDYEYTTLFLSSF